jgi:hypothetical protein
MRFFGLATVLAAIFVSSASAVVITDNFSYPNSAAFESVYTLSNTAGGAWNASFDGSKMTVSNSTPATGAFDSFYARRPIGSVTGNFQASLDLTWNSANEGGERARIALHLLKGDGTGVHPTSLPQFAPWTFPNDAASAGMWNDYGVNAVTLLINGLDDPNNPATFPQFPWRPGPAIGTGGAATVSLKRVGSNLTATYNDGSVVRTHTMANTDEFTHIGIWYSHFTGFPGQFDGSATYTVDNLVVDIPPPLVPGDVDRDGGVDIDDYLLIQANSFTVDPFGEPFLGDVNDDEFVDFDDFHIWKDNFPGGAAAAEAAIAALGVPEPTSLLLGGCSLLMVFLGSSRRSKR